MLSVFEIICSALAAYRFCLQKRIRTSVVSDLEAQCQASQLLSKPTAENQDSGISVCFVKRLLFNYRTLLLIKSSLELWMCCPLSSGSPSMVVVVYKWLVRVTPKGVAIFPQLCQRLFQRFSAVNIWKVGVWCFSQLCCSLSTELSAEPKLLFQDFFPMICLQIKIPVLFFWMTFCECALKRKGAFKNKYARL